MMLDSVELDDQFEWVDEFEWDAIAQEQERSLSGALLVQEGVKLYGRPITLRPLIPMLRRLLILSASSSPTNRS